MQDLPGEPGPPPAPRTRAQQAAGSALTAADVALRTSVIYDWGT
ncbi:MAG TPA: hypothetical protein VKV33_09625 [Streptosporangiaceae bacterium]|nr:hypothetical protein [Streptosporangiaceae bacterium]